MAAKKQIQYLEEKGDDDADAKHDIIQLSCRFGKRVNRATVAIARQVVDNGDRDICSINVLIYYLYKG